MYLSVMNAVIKLLPQSGKIKLIASRERYSLPRKVVTNVLAQVLGFSGVNFCLAFGNFFQALGFS